MSRFCDHSIEMDPEIARLLDDNNEPEKLKKRIEKLESAIQVALNISDLWRPPDDLKIEEYEKGEYNALMAMYEKFKQLLENK